MASPLRFRFRKSFPILGRMLQGTVSKRGVSLNLRLGIFSRSWGTRGTSTTVDMPGTTGMFWRGERRRRRDPDAETGVWSRRLGMLVVWALVALFVLFELARLHLHLGQTCDISGHPHVILALLAGAQLVVVYGLAGRRGLPTWLVLGVLTLAANLLLFNAIVGDVVRCYG